MKRSLILILIGFIFSCYNPSNHSLKGEIIEGDLYFNWLRFSNYYNLEDSTIQKSQLNLKNLTPTNKDDSLLLEHYSTLEKYNLLFSPYIELNINNRSATLFLDSTDYNKITKISLDTLEKYDQKVHIEADAKLILKSQYWDSDLYLCHKIISLKKVEKGNYENRNRKMNGLDYE